MAATPAARVGTLEIDVEEETAGLVRRRNGFKLTDSKAFRLQLAVLNQKERQ